jgi:hypothetical protein
MPIHPNFASCLPKPNNQLPHINNTNTHHFQTLNTSIHPSDPLQQLSTSSSTSSAPSSTSNPSAPAPASASSQQLLLLLNNAGHSTATNPSQHPKAIDVPSSTHLTPISLHATSAASLQIKSELLEDHGSSFHLGHTLPPHQSNLQLEIDGLEIVNENCAMQHSHATYDTDLSDPGGINFDLLD